MATKSPNLSYAETRNLMSAYVESRIDNLKTTRGWTTEIYPYMTGFLQSTIADLLMDLPKAKRDEYIKSVQDFINVNKLQK